MSKGTREAGVKVIRAGAKTARLEREGLSSACVRRAFGAIAPGGSWFCLSKGAFGMLDVVAYLLETTGPADLTLTTWTIGAREITRAWDLVRDARVRSLRLLIDPSFARRQPAYLAALRARFGPDVVRPVICHAKLAILRADGWGLVVASSANLNENKRLEFFRVDDDPALADTIATTLAEWFEMPAEDWWERPAEAHREAFEAWHGSEAEAAAARPVGPLAGLEGPAVGGDAGYFEDGPWGVDVRRAGLVYVR